jgi:general secretion pathway protein H
MSAAVVLAMPDPRGGLVAEAERFAARAKAARDRSMIDARGMSIRLTGAGYGFDIRERAAWRPLDRRPFVDYPWGEGTRALLDTEVARISFDPTGIAEPASLTLERGSERISVEIGQDGGIDVVR